MTASNTKECFREFVGLRLTGLLFDALPLSRGDLQAGNKTLIFEDGRGLTISGSGSYWIDTAEDVQRAITLAEKKLRAHQADLEEVLANARGSS